MARRKGKRKASHTAESGAGASIESRLRLANEWWERRYKLLEDKYWMVTRDSESVRATLRVVDENVYQLMEPLEADGECSFCGASIGHTMELAASSHVRSGSDGVGGCPIGSIRRALLRREYEDKLAVEFGRRESGRSLGIVIDVPAELGYRCKLGHSNLDWSEFNDHLWCNVCERDYHYARECVLVEHENNPKGLPEQPRIIRGIPNWTEDGNGFNDVPAEVLKASH